MFYVYILQSLFDSRYYYGFTTQNVQLFPFRLDHDGVSGKMLLDRAVFLLDLRRETVFLEHLLIPLLE